MESSFFLLFLSEKISYESRFSRFWAREACIRISDWIPAHRNHRSMATILTSPLDLRCCDGDNGLFRLMTTS